jgi:DNA repair protein RecN (Recombination protein N)
LSLVLGKRADLSVLQDKGRKCVIEAEFSLGNYKLEDFFSVNELDYDSNTIIRREIHPGGRSRAFINDSPVTLDLLSQLGIRLIDVHSQHQTLQLTDRDFQLKMLDALAGNKGLLLTYKELFNNYTNTVKELDQLIEKQQNAIKEYDYNSFLFKELETAPLKRGIQEELEERYEQLNNVETILEHLATGRGLLQNEQAGILSMLSELKQIASKFSSFGKAYADLNERIQSIFIETDDISDEILALEESVEANPQQLEEVNGKLQLLYDLRRKHGADSIDELINIREDLGEKIAVTENLDAGIELKRQLLTTYKKELAQKALELTGRRKGIVPQLIKRLEQTLNTLGMPNATFNIEIKEATDFKNTGKDELQFLFSANKGGDYGDLKKIASGGEMSRIMLVIKAILAQYEHLPTMMFDEIDTGVSGELSNRMGEIMHEMSANMQIISITHLPQVASKGDHHFKVYKEDDSDSTHTKMKELHGDERVVELAEMLGGKSLSDSAMAHARELLN